MSSRSGDAPRTRLRLGETGMSERTFSTHDVARMIGTNASSVVRWIESGKLRAYKTPGRHRRIRETDLRTFLDEYGIPLPRDLAGEATRRLIVIDSDGRSAGALARALRRADPNADVTLLSDAVEAMLKVGVAPPEALIVDGDLIDVSALARALRSQPETSKTALIVLLSRSDPEVESRLRALGVRGVLTRPASADQILEAIRAARRGRSGAWRPRASQASAS